MSVHVSEGSQGGTTVAAERSVLAGDQHLWSDVDVGPGSVTGNLNAVR